MRSKLIFSAAAFFLIVFSSCTKRQYEYTDESCFPEDIGRIFLTKCATPGCHNTQSKDAAAGFDLSSWDKMLDGTTGGTAVIPGSPSHSFLLNFINVDPALGTTQDPLMPYNGNPLSKSDYLKIRDWIADGAPNCNGERFSDHPDRAKYYVSNQGCDLIYVFDAERNVVMKAFDAGNILNISEAPHMLRFSPDGKFYYLCFYEQAVSRYFKKFNSADDMLVSVADIGLGSWNTFVISSDSKTAYVIDYNSSKIAVVDLQSMSFAAPFTAPFDPDPGNFVNPHGSELSPDDRFLYVTLQNGNGYYKIDVSVFPPDAIYKPFPFTGSNAQPHEIAFSPDNNYYFITCQETSSNLVRVYDKNDAFIKSIPTAKQPSEMAFSVSKNYLFVTCMEGNTVSVIDYVNHTLIKNITVGSQPHGIDVDDARGIVYVANRNTSTTGPPPHHVSSCAGRNGYLVAIDLNTLELVPGFKKELSVDPYSVRVRK